MAVIVQDLNLIFFLSPGTGSTSLSKFFVEKLNGKWIVSPTDGKHATAAEVKALGYDLQQYICVTTTRNPFDFYISQYHKKRTWQGDDESLVFARSHDFSAFLEKTMQQTPDGFVHPVFLNASDIVLRKECLTEDVRALLTFLKCSTPVELPQENVSIGLTHELSAWYTPEQLDLVWKKHEKHLDRFGYGRTNMEPDHALVIGDAATKKARRIGSFMVMEGQENWLYLADSSNRVVSHAAGRYNARGRWGDEWHRVLSERHRIANAKGAKYAHFIVPNTHTAVPAFLPPEITVARPRPVDHLADHLAKLNFHDLTGLFLRSDPAECFSPTDSHWSAYGAYLAYQSICKTLDVPSIELGRGAFKWHDSPGDLGLKFSPPRSSKALVVDPDASARSVGPSSMVLTNHVEVLGKIRVLQALRPLVNKRLLILGDSYTYTNLQFFAATFCETYFLHTICFNRQLMNEINPDFVIGINCERFILDSPRNSDAREYVAEYASKLLIDARSGQKQPPPSLLIDAKSDMLSRVQPLFASLEEAYDATFRIDGITMRRIEEMYITLMNRRPKPADVFDKWHRHKSLRSVILEFIESGEFGTKRGITVSRIPTA